MKKGLIIVLAAIMVIVIAVIVFLGNIDSIVKKGIETAGPKILQAPVTLNKADISVFSGTGELKGFTIGNPEGFKTDHAYKMDRLTIELDTGSVTSDKIHIKNVVVDSPGIVFEGGFGKNNLSQLQANAKSFSSSGGTKQKTPSDTQGKKIQIDLMQIRNASVSVSMGLLQGKKLTVPLPPLELKDIGKDKDTSIAEALAMVLGSINSAVIPAVQESVGSIGKEVKNVGDTFKKETEGGLEKLKGIFGK